MENNSNAEQAMQSEAMQNEAKRSNAKQCKTMQSNKAKNNSGIRDIKGKEHWISKKAAAYLGISKMCLYNYRKKRKLSGLKFGGGVYYQKEWLDNFIEELTDK